MSKHDYNTARSLSLREAADPANRAKARAYLEQMLPYRALRLPTDDRRNRMSISQNTSTTIAPGISTG
ncbi:hypothetical protein [Pseudomonas farris]